MRIKRPRVIVIIAALAAALVATGVAAATERKSPVSRDQPAPKKKGRAAETAFGREGDSRKATRVIRIDTSDAMRFFPDQVKVKRGETVRFVVRNRGQLPHGLVLGTMDDLKAHAELMRKHPNMEHDEPYMAHVQPGKTGSIVWQFTRPGAFYYGCLVPGHFEAGMVGIVRVRADVGAK